ncbi:MAG TPA: MBOAT family O-acyltransferase [Anaerolineales bacterium]|nr:MBOAT family O-acyltransferase [Anaerolineales bacterium]
MSFTGLTFWVFLALVLAAYWMLPERQWKNILLLGASYVFYGWVSAWLACLLGLSTLADYFLAQGMRVSPSRTRLLLIVSILLNVGVLAFFKYYNFFGPDLARLLDAFGIGNDFLLVRILFPLGLSFYTLKKLSYTIDVARGTLQPTHSVVDFALYVSFFPQLIAGPIDRPQKLLPQIEAQQSWKAEFFYNAWPLILMGLFKKVVIADSIKVMVDQVFSLDSMSLFLFSMGALAFTLQILADFSGYTDIARGVALLFGFQTSENFNRPYLSLTPTDFWNRWHITLSTWLRDYIFFPIRRALLRSRVRLPGWLLLSIPPIVTMFGSGLWHGAGWTFVVWGLYYGVLISLYQLLGIRGEWRPKSPAVWGLAWLTMFFLIVFGWGIFRAPSLAWLGNILFNMPFIAAQNEFIVGLITLSMAIVYSAPLLIKFVLDRLSTDSWLHSAYYAVASVLIVVFISSSSPDFIYFQF